MSQSKKNHAQTKSLHLCQSGHSIFSETCRSCNRLKSEWYDYAQRATDFFDIEKKNHDNDHKSCSDLRLRSEFQHQETYEAKLEYSLWATEMLNVVEFKSETDKNIWEYHSEGLSRDKIAPRVGLGGRWISRKIHMIEDYIKEQVYNPLREQMCSTASVSMMIGAM